MKSLVDHLSGENCIIIVIIIIIIILLLARFLGKTWQLIFPPSPHAPNNRGVSVHNAPLELSSPDILYSVIPS